MKTKKKSIPKGLYKASKNSVWGENSILKLATSGEIGSWNQHRLRQLINRTPPADRVAQNYSTSEFGFGKLNTRRPSGRLQSASREDGQFNPKSIHRSTVAGKIPIRFIPLCAMPNYGAKFSSRYISTDEMSQFANDLPEFMRELFSDTKWMIVQYGWSCNLHQDLLLKPMRVLYDVFPYFLEDSIEQKIFEFGVSDLHVDSVSGDVKILLCHESDIHIDGNNDKLIRTISAGYPNLEFRTGDEWKLYNDQNPTRDSAE